MRREPLPLTVPLPALDHGARASLASLYADLDRELGEAGASCRACGSCCRLSEWGHELRVTPLELALLVERHGLRPPAGPGVCPYLEDGRCTAREGRALGCRAFHCGLPAVTVEDAAARAFAALGALHVSLGVPCEQGDLLASLSHLAAEGGPGAGAQVGSRPATRE
jgi:hypothetical protein